MTDPATFTVATLTALAASKFVGKAAEKAAEVIAPDALKQASELVSKLWTLIKQKSDGNERAKAALEKVEAGDEAALAQVEEYLDDELTDPKNQAFATEVQQLAQQIMNVQQQVQVQQTNVNQGRDQFVINNPTGDLKLGGS